MIERVAKVIWDEFCPGIRMTDHDKAEYENTARKVIEAMCEPTNEMMVEAEVAVPSLMCFNDKE